MTIMLDNVSSLLHFPFAGNFFIVPVINQEIACMKAELFLGVIPGMAMEEFKAKRGAHFLLSWL